MKFWVGQSIAVFGAQFSPLAIQVIAYRLGATPFQFGILAFLNTVPFLILGLFAGLWLDRHRRRRVLILSDVGRSLVLFSIPVSAILYVVTLDMLYVVTCAAGVLTVFFEIGYQAYVPSLVEREQIVDANSKLETTRSLSQALGPSVAGVVVQYVSPPLAVLGDTLGYTSSWVSLSLIRKPDEAPKGPRKSALHDIKEGLALVFKDPKLRSIAGCTATSNLFSAAFGTILTLFFLQNLGMNKDPVLVGVIYGIGSLGGVVGALLAIRVARRLGVGMAIIVGSVIFSLLSALFYFATPSNGFVLGAAILFFSYIGVLIYNVTQVSYRQALVPREIQGRMNASIRTLVWGIIPVGNILGGTVAQVIGVKETVVLMAVLCMISPLWVIFSPVRHVRDFPRA
jgi:predicted MFS family arabinose efflux permease